MLAATTCGQADTPGGEVQGLRGPYLQQHPGLMSTGHRAWKGGLATGDLPSLLCCGGSCSRRAAMSSS